jgi:hypothetical protein
MNPRPGLLKPELHRSEPVPRVSQADETIEGTKWIFKRMFFITI